MRNKVSKLIGEITSNAYLVSWKGGYHVQVEYSPHVQWISIRVFKGGWTAAAINSSPFEFVNVGIDEEGISYFRNQKERQEIIQKQYEAIEDKLQQVLKYIKSLK